MWQVGGVRRRGPESLRPNLGILQKQPRPVRTLRGFVNHPLTDLVVMVAILLSVILLVIEESMVLPPDSWIPVISECLTGLFAVELTLRFIIAKKRGRFFRRYWPDLLALLPLLRPLRFFRFFRLFRLFRLFQLGLLLDRRVSLLRGLLRVNFYFLWVLVVMTIILVLGSAVIIFLLEQGNSPNFESMQQSFWWAVYTIISGEPVGAIPQTIEGRALLAMMMLSGMTLFAVFTGIVSATMMNRLQGTDRVAELDIDELDNHIIIFGWNAGVTPLIAELAVDPKMKGVPVLLVNELEERPDLTATGYRSDLLYFLKGDYTQPKTLSSVGVKSASRAVVMADDVRSHDIADRDARSVLTVLTIERMNPEIYCVVELMNAANRDTLNLVNVEAVIMRSDLSGRALASACRHANLMDVMMNLLTMRRGEVLHRIPGPTEAIAFGLLMPQVKKETDALLVGIERGGAPNINPPSDLSVQPEDFLIVIGSPKAVG